MANESTKKVIPRKRKPRGSGKEPLLALRAPPSFTAAVDDWAKQQPDQPSRSEAIRRMVEGFLKMKARRDAK
jgi:hypothetical protein